MKTYSDEELAGLINEVEIAFNENLTKAEVAKEEKIEKKEEVKTEAIEKSEETKEADLAKKEEKKVTIDELYASMTKSELEAHKTAMNSVESIEKAEKKEAKEDKIEKTEVESLREENDELKKSIEKLASVLTKKLTPSKEMPKQKAIAEIGIIKKTEEETITKTEEKDFSKLSQKDIAKSLSEKVREGSLNKSDRDAIMNYYADSSKDIKSIKHLL